MAESLKILYASVLTENDSSLYRMWALQREGHTTLPVDMMGYFPTNPLLYKFAFRMAAGPWVNRLNSDILHLAERERPQIVWADKLLWMQPRTLDRLRELGIATVSYMIDNPFGPRRDPGWRLYMDAIPHYDLHVTQRDVSMLEYQRRGARDAMKVQTAYEPTIHYPPATGWSDSDRNREVSFVGTPYDDRAEQMTRLWREHNVPMVISGNERSWRKALDAEAFNALYREGELFQQRYREAIWRSKINLSFLTHSNQDEYTHKSFEIAACGGFLLAERSAGHTEKFVEGEEAEFFSSFDELREKIQRYLPDEAARNRIAAAGQRRAHSSGYSNDAQVAKIVERMRSKLAQKGAQ